MTTGQPAEVGSTGARTGRYDTGLCVLAGCMLLAGLLATQVRVARVKYGAFA